MAKVTGPLSYHIELGDGCVVRRHVDAVCARRDSADPSPLLCPRMTYTFQPKLPHLHLLLYLQLNYIRIPTTMDIDFQLPPVSEGEVSVHYLNSEH